MSVSRTVVSATGTTTPASAPAVAPQGPLVLLIEDDAGVADVVEHLLTRHGNRVLRAHDAAEGSRHFSAHENEVALVILDCGLPDADGVTVCRTLRRLAPKLPIILTSGWESAPARAMAGDGPTVFLQKPFFPAEVVKVVSAFIAANR